MVFNSNEALENHDLTKRDVKILWDSEQNCDNYVGEVITPFHDCGCDL